MIRKITLLLTACLCINYAVKAQYCGFDHKHQHELSSNSAYAQSVSQFNTKWTNWLNAQQNPNNLIITNGTDTTYEIPVVVHIIDTAVTTPGSLYNPTDATIRALIDTVNKAWEAALSGYPNSSNGGTKVNIRFVLAKRDPNCNATTGIIRINGGALSASYKTDGVKHDASGSGEDEVTVKSWSKWPNTDYYNIWIVAKFDGSNGLNGGLAGFAYFPGASADKDGTMMLARQATPTATMANHNHVLTHELGHAFALYHTFEGTCPSATNCSSNGDLCCDTEPMEQAANIGTCPTTNTCTGNPFTLNTQHNYMNYSTCKDRFTPNQRDRMMAALLGPRASLIASLGATPLPSSSLPSACVPTYANPGSPLDRGPIRVTVNYNSNPLLDISSGGYVTEGNKVYVDNTCKYMLTLAQGETYQFRCSTSTNNQVAKAYIDLNNDGVLGNSAGETINLTRTGLLHSANYTVPLSSNVVGCTLLRMRVVADEASKVDSCGPLQYGQAEDYLVTVLGTNGGSSNSYITINQPPAGGNPSCLNSTLIISITTHGNPTVTNYAWYRKTTGGTVTPGPSCATCSTWTSNAFTNLDSVWVVMSFQSSCGNADTTSDTLVLNRPLSIPPSVTIGLVYGAFPSCIDDSISVGVVSNSNPGGAPTYQWKLNGGNIGPSNAGPTFNATGLPEGSIISVVMTSSAGAPCAVPSTATSNSVIIDTAFKKPSVTVSLISGTNPGCAGQLLSFKAFPKTGGLNPTFQWYLNGSLVTGVNGNTYTSVFNNNDQVYVRITSNSPCSPPSPNNSATSTPITVTHIKLTADITIVQTSGNNPLCSGKLASFAANPISAGANPTFQWMLNGSIITGANGSTYITDSLKNNDTLRCILIATDPCVINSLDTSDPLVMTVIPSKYPSVNISITDGKNPGCLDSLVEFTAISVDLGNNPLFTWKINGFDVATGQNKYSSNAFLNGDLVQCCASQTDGGCYIPDTVCSNTFSMVRSETPDPPIIHFIGNKLITNIQPGSYLWFGPDGRLNLGGEDGNFLPQLPGYYWAVTNNNGCWSKPSNVLNVILLDVNTIDFDGMKVYPNPTAGKLVIDWDKTNVTVDIHVYNAIGQRVITDQMINASRKELDLGALPNGIYHIVLKGADGKAGDVKVKLIR